MKDREKRIALLEKRVQILKEALWFYVDPSEKQFEKDWFERRTPYGTWEVVYGKKAIRALKKSKELK